MHTGFVYYSRGCRAHKPGPMNDRSLSGLAPFAPIPSHQHPVHPSTRSSQRKPFTHKKAELLARPFSMIALGSPAIRNDRFRDVSTGFV
jgi:hypothetical protein